MKTSEFIEKLKIMLTEYHEIEGTHIVEIEIYPKIQKYSSGEIASIDYKIKLRIENE
jgi:hypothetical protein